MEALAAGEKVGVYGEGLLLLCAIQRRLSGRPMYLFLGIPREGTPVLDPNRQGGA